MKSPYDEAKLVWRLKQVWSGTPYCVLCFGRYVMVGLLVRPPGWTPHHVVAHPRGRCGSLCPSTPSPSPSPPPRPVLFLGPG
jgi:hypothetical protein